MRIIKCSGVHPKSTTIFVYILFTRAKKRHNKNPFLKIQSQFDMLDTYISMICLYCLNLWPFRLMNSLHLEKRVEDSGHGIKLWNIM